MNTPVGGKRGAMVATPDHAIANIRTLRARYEPCTLPTPDPFSTSMTEHAHRRAFTDSVLRPDLPLHPRARGFAAVARTEAATLLGTVGYAEFGWPEFSAIWWAAARRITLGEAAREDQAATDPRAVSTDVIAAYLRSAEPGSLAAEVAHTPVTSGVDPIAQVRHWLYGFGAAGIITFRALALLATHPDQARVARDELAATDVTELSALPYLRACVLESVRRWPMNWGPDDFSPDQWLDGTAWHRPALPFTAGCPGRNIVLSSAATMLAALLAQRDFTLLGGPSTEHASLRFITRRAHHHRRLDTA
jgi:hypothetical protein